MEPTSGQLPAQALGRTLRQRAWVVVLCTVLVPLVAYVATSRQAEQYVATAELLLGGPEVATSIVRGDAAGSSSDEGAAATSLDLASTRTIAERAAGALGTGASADQVQSAVEVTPRDDSNVLEVQATGPTRAQVAPIANAYAEQYIAFRRESARGELERAEEIINDQISSALDADRQGRADDLRDQRDELRLLARLQTGGAELLERAQAPTAASSPRPGRAAALGLGFGLVLGAGLALLFEFLSRPLNDPREAEALFPAPMLGAIPTSRALRTGRKEGSVALSSAEQAPFQRVRANLEHFNDFNVSSILIVSALPGEGKSTLSWNLAVAAVEAGRSVLLLEADLRIPTFVRDRGMRPGPGLSAVLGGHAEPDEVIQRVALPGSNGRAPRILDVICAGEAQADPSYLVESPRMERLILDLEERYELVVVDTPPALVVSDSMAFVEYVSGVLVVTHMGKNTRDAADQLRRQLDNAGAPLLGLVVNATRPAEGYAGYSYTYEGPHTVAG